MLGLERFLLDGLGWFRILFFLLQEPESGTSASKQDRMNEQCYIFRAF